MSTEIQKLTLEEIQNNPPVINKKFLLINSSYYTDEAYDYLLKLVDNTDSICFICDKQQIYTHGEIYGGDVWKNNLFYFRTFQIIDNGNLLSDISATKLNDVLRISSGDNIKFSIEEEYAGDEVIKTLNISLDLDNIVNTAPFTIDDPTAIFNLKYENNQISIDKYIPIRVDVDDNSLIEYDTTNTEFIEFYLNIYGTELNKNINVTTTSNENISIENNKVISTIKSNNDIDYLILYSDGKTEGSLHYFQKFGYRICWGIYEITKYNFLGQEHFLSNDKCDCEFYLDIPEYEFGWFACPSSFNPIFKDVYSGLTGGWKKYSTFIGYSKNIEYTVYRTENSGLGNTKWFITNK